MEAPALAFEHLLAEAVTVAGGGRGVIAGAVGLDRQHHAPRLVGVRAGEVDAVAGNAELGCDRDPATFESILDRELERIERDIAQPRAQVLAA